jgi:NADH-quinone oxidoreductase subunit K
MFEIAYYYYKVLNYIPLKESFYFSFSLFFIGFIGIILNKQNSLILLMSAEIMLLGLSLNFIIFSAYYLDPKGQIFALFIMTIAAAETAIGLGLLVITYRVVGDINFSLLKNFKH